MSLRTDALTGEDDDMPLLIEWEWPRSLIFQNGTNVVLTGLTNMTELNGRRGIVVGYDHERERYRVQLDYRPRPVEAKVENTRYDTRKAADPLESGRIEEWEDPLPDGATLPPPGWHPECPSKKTPPAILEGRLPRRQAPVFD